MLVVSRWIDIFRDSNIIEIQFPLAIHHSEPPVPFEKSRRALPSPAVPLSQRLKAFQSLILCAETNVDKARKALVNKRPRLFHYHIEVAKSCHQDARSLWNPVAESLGDGPDGDAASCEVLLRLANRVFSEMEDACREDRIGFPGVQNINHVI